MSTQRGLIGLQFLDVNVASLHPDEVFFTADTHFGHENIIKHCSRPFQSSRHMGAALGEAWNDVVPPDALVFILGDMFFKASPRSSKALIQGLHGQKVLVLGNHDRLGVVKAIAPHLAGVAAYLEIDVKDKEARGGHQHIVLSHYGMRVWNKKHHGSWQFYGHSHNTMPPRGPQIDVGVDAHNYKPISYPEAKKAVQKATEHHK